ncbi:MAG: LD-carboxypeptidase [Parachlamydiaceae bacterium]|nr:LD-carboxypeptidase [Parachlamydiaceae bacterium]
MRRYFILLFIYSLQLAAEQPVIYPPALQKGDLIALVFPASYLVDQGKKAQEIINRKAKWLEQKGYRTILYPTKIHPEGYLAGSDTQRAAALMNAWKNPKVKAIWCFRGGYGTPRILDLLDYDWIHNNPKILIGMSDITALHQAIRQKTGLVTFLGPVLNYFDEKEGDFDGAYAFSEVEQLLVEHRVGTIPMPVGFTPFKILKQGKAQGRLVGGNLSLIASLCGTRWEIDTDNKILVLEDVGEEIYRIDRLLWQLQDAGLFENPAGIILSSWHDCKSTSQGSVSLQHLFEHYFDTAHYPVVMGFPSGHCKYQTTLPLNVLAEIDTKEQTVTLLTSAVSNPPKEKPSKKSAP